jgi:hypothetical protein
MTAKKSRRHAMCAISDFVVISAATRSPSKVSKPHRARRNSREAGADVLFIERWSDA